MAKIERVPVSRRVAIGGYVAGWEFDNIIRELDEAIHDDHDSGMYAETRHRIKITIELIED